MRLLLSTAMVALLVSAVLADGVQRPSTRGSLALEIGSTLLKYGPAERQLQYQASRLCDACERELKTAPKGIREVSSMVLKRLDATAIQEKLNLTTELWKIRASLDLSSLLSPQTLRDLIGPMSSDGSFAQWVRRLR